MATVRHTIVLGGTRPSKKYDGKSPTFDQLIVFLNEFKFGNARLSIDHQEGVSIPYTLASIDIVPTEDGQHLELVAEIDLDEKEVQRFEGRQGFSLSFSDKTWEVNVSKSMLAPIVSISVEASFYDDSIVIEAAQEIAKSLDATIYAQRLYEYSDALETAKVILEVSYIAGTVVTAIGPDLVASAIWDGIKLFVVTRINTAFKFKREVPSLPTVVVHNKIIHEDGKIEERWANIPTESEQIAKEVIREIFK